MHAPAIGFSKDQCLLFDDASHFSESTDIAAKNPALALALKLNVPVWSNDIDFEDAGVEWYTTA